MTLSTCTSCKLVSSCAHCSVDYSEELCNQYR
jgi:hypothetical protein